MINVVTWLDSNKYRKHFNGFLLFIVFLIIRKDFVCLNAEYSYLTILDQKNQNKKACNNCGRKLKVFICVFILCLRGKQIKFLFFVHCLPPLAQYLNDQKILVPRLYFKYNRLKEDATAKEMNMWTRTILNKLINNEQYTGKLIYGRYKLDKIRGKTATKVPRDKWIITENAHEPIVSEELFNSTKSRQAQARKGVKLNQNLFSGKVVCGCCGRNFYTWTKEHVLLCQTPSFTGNSSGCYDKKIPEKLLVDLITAAIEFVTVNGVDKIGMVKKEIVLISEELESVKRELQNEEGRLERVKFKKEKLFHSLMDNQIDDDEYMKLSLELEREEMTLVDLVKTLKKEIKKVTAKKKEREGTINTFKELGKIKVIDRDVVDRFIEKITISKEGRVELEWKFENIFQDAKSA